MSIWIFIAIVFNVFLALSVGILWIRQIRPAKEDPRMSRGLQLLQSKIAVLEDLSDRTELQVKQLTQILDERTKGLQQKLLKAEEILFKIEQSTVKSLEVAEIFQDKIPHEEIIQRNQTSKYVKAAKLAHEGYSVDEIVAEVDLPKSEVEFIAKVNRDELTFNPEALPEWAKPKEDTAKMVEKVFHAQAPDLTALQMVEQNFKQSVRDVAAHEAREAERLKELEAKAAALKQTVKSATQGIGNAIRQTAEQTGPLIRKVQFPRVFVDKG